MLEFMGEHPVLTFFLATIIAECVVRVVGIVTGNVHVCSCEIEEKDEL